MGRKSRKARKRKGAERQRARSARVAAEQPAWASWPVSGAYMSYLDAFRICGQALMFFCRKSSADEFAFLLSTLDFFRGGLVHCAIVEAVSEDEFLEEFLAGSAVEAGHLMGPAEPEMARRIFWATYEFMRDQGYMFPNEELARLRAFIPKVHGASMRWLTGPDGLLDPRLLDVALLEEGEADIPADKESLIITTARFHTQDPDALLAWMRNAEPEIFETDSDEDGFHFTWTRGYPKGHWSPFARRRGARQSLGTSSFAATRSRWRQGPPVGGHASLSFSMRSSAPMCGSSTWNGTVGGRCWTARKGRPSSGWREAENEAAARRP